MRRYVFDLVLAYEIRGEMVRSIHPLRRSWEACVLPRPNFNAPGILPVIVMGDDNLAAAH